MTTISGHNLIEPSPHALARFCARIGWRVMPLHPETKRPAIRDWPTRATTDPDQIAEWWRWSHVGCPVGILTGPESGIWVLDIDVKWCNGFKALRELFESHNVSKPPPTLRVWTPSHGQQWYFKYPDLDSGWKVSNTTSSSHRPGKLGPGLEVRGWHGQVVAPMQSGRPIICEDLSAVPVPIDAPDWLLDLVMVGPRKCHSRELKPGKRPFESTLDVLVQFADILGKMSRGGRNAELNRTTFMLGNMFGAADLLQEDTARAVLWDACLRNGLIADDGEESFNATFTSGWSAGITAGDEEYGRVR